MPGVNVIGAVKRIEKEVGKIQSKNASNALRATLLPKHEAMKRTFPAHYDRETEDPALANGLDFFEQISVEDLPHTLRNWMRRLPKFEKMQFSYVGAFEGKDELAMKEGVTVTKVELAHRWASTRSEKTGKEIMFWEQNGLDKAAEILASIVAANSNALAFELTKEGIILYTGPKGSVVVGQPVCDICYTFWWTKDNSKGP